MFEALITKLLNKVLGNFIENIDPEQLNISLLRGDIIMTNMKLRSDLFEALPVPFALDYGQIGLIRMRIPMWNMFRSPLIIEISDVLAVIRPKHIKEWSEEVEIKAYKDAGQKLLDQYELFSESEAKMVAETSSVD